MRPHFSELFRRKLDEKSAWRVSRARQWQDLCISSIQHSVKQPLSVLLLLLQTAGAAGLNPHFCSCIAAAPGQGQQTPTGCGSTSLCQPRVLLAVLFGDSLTKAVSAGALSGSSHHSSTTLPVLSLDLLSAKAETADPKLHDAVSWLCDPESFPSCAT